MPGKTTISVLHLTGGLLTFDAFMHYIIQHHHIFPNLVEVHYHWCCPGEAYDLDEVLLVVGKLPIPLTPPRHARYLTVTTDNGALEEVDRVGSQAEVRWKIPCLA